MKNIMLDLETMGNGSNAAIISIGAVFFEPKTGELGAEFYQSVSLESAMEYGSVDASTLQWWMKQSEQARSVFNDRTSLLLNEVLIEFSDWLCQLNMKNIKVWGNGATFDNVILSNAYQALKMPRPWPYWCDRDVRTIVEMGKSLRGIDPKKDLTLQGTAHNALDDAKFQVRYVSEIFKALA